MREPDGVGRTIALILAADLVGLAALYAFCSFNVEYLSRWLGAKSFLEAFGSTSFILGAVLAGIGALVGIGYGETIAEASTARMGVESGPEFMIDRTKEREGMRRRQLSDGFILALFALPFLLLGFAAALLG